MNPTDVRTNGIRFASFLRHSADLVHRAADTNVMQVINLDEILLTVQEFVDDLNGEVDDEDELSEDDDVLDVYDEP